MNRLSTKILKALIPACLYAIAASSFSASAEEYKSMIRYDRVWECFSEGNDDYNLVVKCMKFVGTEEINGKEYHKIETFRKTFPKYDTLTRTYSYENYVAGLSQHEGYLREENGVAYTLIVCKKDRLPIYDGVFDTGYGQLFIPGKNEPGQDEVIVEIPVYDFSHKQGESYYGMSFCEGNSHSCTFTVYREDNMEIDGEEYRKIWLTMYESEGNEYYSGEEFIEGIGVIEYGCLNYHELYLRPTKIWVQNYFNRLLDLDGNVIFAPHALYNIPYESLQTPDGVDIIKNPTDNSPIYDILGRRISAPTPGQLYIQGGKKHIAQ